MEGQQSAHGLKSREYYAGLKQGTEEWLLARKDFDLTGSEIGAAVGLGRFRTRLQLYEEKKGTSQQDRQADADEALLYGHLHEADAAADFARKQGMVLEETGIWVIEHGSIKLGVSPDRLVLMPSEEFGNMIHATYEAKCPSSGRLFNPPHAEYVLQVHAQIQAVGVDEGYLHCWTPRNALRFRITRDDKLWALVLDRLEGFANDHLRKGVPPSPGAEGEEDDPDRVRLLKLLGGTIRLMP